MNLTASAIAALPSGAAHSSRPHFDKKVGRFAPAHGERFGLEFDVAMPDAQRVFSDIQAKSVIPTPSEILLIDSGLD